MSAVIQGWCHFVDVIFIGMFAAMVSLRWDLSFFQLSSTVWSYRACMELCDQLSTPSFIFNHRALEKTNTFLGDFLLMTGDCVLSTTIAVSWSDILGTTVVVLTRVGRLVMWRSRTQSPLVGSLWVRVRWNSRSMSMKWLHAETVFAPVLTSSCSQFMSSKLKSPPRMILVLCLFPAIPRSNANDAWRSSICFASPLGIL